MAVPITFGAAGALRIAVEGGTPTEEASIEAVAADLGLWTVASYLAILASILMLPFALGLLRFAPPGRGRLAALVGTALVHLGAMGFAGYNTLNFTVLSASARHGDRGEAVRVLATIEEALEGSVLLTMFLTGIIFGFVVLAVGLLRARILPRWSPVALLVAVALFTFGSGSAWVTAASGAAMLVASAPAALWLTRAGGSIPAHAAAGAPR